MTRVAALCLILCLTVKVGFSQKEDSEEKIGAQTFQMVKETMGIYADEKLLKEVEGHSVEELAEMTGMNENTIKVKLFRTRQKLVKAAQRLGKGGTNPFAG